MVPGTKLRQVLEFGPIVDWLNPSLVLLLMMLPLGWVGGFYFIHLSKGQAEANQFNLVELEHKNMSSSSQGM